MHRKSQRSESDFFVRFVTLCLTIRALFIAVGLLNTLKHECKHCNNLCRGIAYHYQVTTSGLQNASHLWKDVNTEKTNKAVPKWYSKNLNYLVFKLDFSTNLFLK